MVGQDILIIGVIIYFIKEQYNFSDVRRLNFLFIPLFSLFQFLKQMNFNQGIYVLWLGIITVVSLAIGYYQANHSKVIQEKRVVSYFTDQEGREVPIYRKVVQSSGGTHYLFGWLLIFVFQLLMESFLFHKAITVSGSSKEILDEIIKDIFSVYRVYDTEKTSWYVWALYGISSLSYTYFLGKKSPEFKEKIVQKHVSVS
ncbi:MAG: hypothetical protein RR554_11880 [Vagococcus sp.]|uniref:hypothetical protein n=1 Tax=Vagococcus sp. TaxID=1933889 RepID=UPI002FC59511